MRVIFKFILVPLVILVVASCGSGRPDDNEKNINLFDIEICECYEKEHRLIKVDYDLAMLKDSTFWKSKFSQLKKIDVESINDLISSFKRGDVIVRQDSSEIMEYKNKIKSYLIYGCLSMSSVVDESMQYYLNAGGNYIPWDFSKESFDKRLLEHQDALAQLNNDRWLKPFYLNIVQNIYNHYVRMLSSEKAKADLAEIEAKKLRKQEGIEEYARLHPPPPPPDVRIELVPDEEYEIEDEF